MKNLTLEHVHKEYGKTTVIEDLSMEIREGERLILLGPSGCGKSTLLRMIAGLEPVTGGTIRMGDRIVNHVPAGKRNVSMVFQNYAIYPHMTVRKNITYGLKVSHLDSAVIERRLDEVLDMLRLTEYADRKPKDLSGGQRQRVALARAVVKQADYFLLDEPLSNLDAQLRMHSRKELVKIHEKYHPTMIYVTHDQVEAMTVGQRIALMNAGSIEMLDTPGNIYHFPANVFCARFIGSPPMNIIEKVPYNRESLVIGASRVYLPEEWRTEVIGKHPDSTYTIGIRPEHLKLIRTGLGEWERQVKDADMEEENASSLIRGQVRYIENYGNQAAVYVRPEGLAQDLVVMENGRPPRKGELVSLKIDFRNFHLFSPEDGKSLGWPAACIREVSETVFDNGGPDEYPAQHEHVQHEDIPEDSAVSGLFPGSRGRRGLPAFSRPGL